MLHPADPSSPSDPARRRALRALAGGVFVLGAGGALRAARAGPAPAAAPQVLAGTQFDLVVARAPVNLTGRVRDALVINGQFPGPLLHWREGDTVTLRVHNRLDEPTSIHWHGILLPADMDGVPGLSFPGIAPGASHTYRFPLRQRGTYWYHSHSGLQEQEGLYGGIVIAPREAGALRADREFTLLLSDWSDTPARRILATLKRQSDYYNRQRATLPDLLHEAAQAGIGAALAERGMWDRMRMRRGDLSDVGGGAYTYLCNGLPPQANWSGVFRPGERLRLRLINGSAMTYFDVRIPGLAMTVVSADGQEVEPVTVDELRLGVAETCDVIVSPGDAAYTVFAQALDRSGYARATLAPHAGLAAPVPALDPLPRLTMTDMMGAAMHGAHGGHGHGAGAAMAGMSMGAAGHAHAAQALEPVQPAWTCSTSPAVDMCVTQPRQGLDDPGPGLRDNGRRVLSYADLHTLGGALDARAPQRELTLHLTGNMERYVWGFDGRKYSQAAPIALRYGERLRVTLINDTMMHHPIHLHGMWSEVIAPDGSFQVRKHTVTVQPAQQVQYLVSADAPGRWAYHCHMLYHMEAGMFREVVVA